jgi:hypothetical protein
VRTRSFPTGILVTFSNWKQQNNFRFQSNTKIYYFIVLTTCFGHLTITRPYLHNAQYSTCSADNDLAIWDHTRLTNVLKYIKNCVRWTVFVACHVLQLFVTTSKLLEAETKLKLTRIIHLQTSVLSCITWCYYNIYVYIFSSHKLLHMVWREGSWIVSLHGEFRMAMQTFLYLSSMFILSLSVCLSQFSCTTKIKRLEIFWVPNRKLRDVQSPS